MEDALATAKDLVDEGATFIEMGSWFDDDKAQAVIATADSEIPIGCAGRNEKRK